ncbi:hypothetical protein [Cellulomonas chengniuliangii]|uniref:hypothetical protein n=1 Tax=Cellulomonas chengniuliangii TaxID=2968084 RepID=UPI001D0E2C0E|nr:hypothetical protein [Cellulomonas chengniuliangii]MCC2317496.1 hypothetical protein [Cellulomonas chengniuliangii]
MTNDHDAPEPRPHPPTPSDDPFHYGLPSPGRHAEEVGPPDPSDAALLEALLGALGGRRGGPAALWFLVLDAEDRPLPVVLPIEHATIAPSRTVGLLLVRVLASVVEHAAPGGSVVIGYVRDEGGAVGAFERGWSRLLRALAAHEGLRIRAEVAVGPRRAGVVRGRW